MNASRVPIEQARILVAGVGRNCGATIRPTLDALARATAGFRETRFLVVESDSTDDTPERLSRLCASFERLRTIHLGALQTRLPRRTERIAHCRNVIVDAVAGGEERDVDYVVMADLDGVNRTVTRAGIESAWSAPEPWDAVAANQTGRYYDVWALRHPVWSPDDCWAAARALEPLFGRRAARRLTVQARQMRLPADAGLVEVGSAFGGLAIYARDAFASGRYVGLDAEGSEICEHVPFHAGLRAEGRRLFVNAALLNASQSEHLGGIGTLPARLRAFAAGLSVTRSAKAPSGTGGA